MGNYKFCFSGQKGTHSAKGLTNLMLDTLFHNIINYINRDKSYDKIKSEKHFFHIYCKIYHLQLNT